MFEYYEILQRIEYDKCLELYKCSSIHKLRDVNFGYISFPFPLTRFNPPFHCHVKRD